MAAYRPSLRLSSVQPPVLSGSGGREDAGEPGAAVVAAKPPRLLDQVRAKLRILHYSIRTEEVPARRDELDHAIHCAMRPTSGSVVVGRGIDLRSAADARVLDVPRAGRLRKRGI